MNEGTSYGEKIKFIFKLTTCTFIGKIGKGSSIEKAKIVDRGSLCNAPESTGSKLQ